MNAKLKLNKITNEEKIMKKQRGITLVALVVTIIVLIILAGVSINLILGENGIINKAAKAKEQMELAQREEEEALDNLLEEIKDKTEGESYISAIAKVKIAALLAEKEQPRAASKIETVCNKIIAEIKSSNKNAAMALGKFGVSLCESIAICPEAYETEGRHLKLVETTIIEGIKSGEDNTAIGLATLGAGWSIAVAEQPEAADKLETASNKIITEMKSESEKEATALGKFGASLCENIARQPELYSWMQTIADKLVIDIKDSSEKDALELANTISILLEACVDYPEDKDNLINAYEEIKQQ